MFLMVEIFFLHDNSLNFTLSISTVSVCVRFHKIKSIVCFQLCRLTNFSKKRRIKELNTHSLNGLFLEILSNRSHRGYTENLLKLHLSPTLKCLEF